MDVYEAWHFLHEHPMFKDADGLDYFTSCLDIWVTRVDPQTRTVEDDDSRNTVNEVWLECGPWCEPAELRKHSPGVDFQRGMPSHDIALDCGGNTFEEALRELAKKVVEHYGDYRSYPEGMLETVEAVARCLSPAWGETLRRRESLFRRLSRRRPVAPPEVG